MAWAAGKNPKAGREVTVWEPAKLVQDAQSTYSSHYRAWPVTQQARGQKPKDARPPSAGAFDTRTTQQPQTAKEPPASVGVHAHPVDAADLDDTPRCLPAVAA